MKARFIECMSILFLIVILVFMLLYLNKYIDNNLYRCTNNIYADDDVILPIIMYHHISNSKNSTLTPEKLEKDLTDIKDVGYTTVFYKDIYDYVYNNKSLPQNPIIISFDDGYLSNYIYLYQLLQKLNMKVEIAIIGWSVGLSDDVKNTIR